MNSVMKVILERRSVRSFDESKAVSESLLTEIVKAGAYAPSAMNRQAWHFTVVENRELLSKLNDAVLIIVSMSENALYPREDVGCCMQNMMLAATSLGLGSCWINQLGNGASEDKGVREVLGEMRVPQGNKVYAALAVGYGLGHSPLKDRAHGVVDFGK